MRKLNYRELEHTGDLAIEVTAASREQLFADAIVAMGRLMVEEAGVTAVNRRRLTVAAADDLETMHDLLAAALNIFLVDAFIWSDAHVVVRDGSAQATLVGEKFDSRRHHLLEELKAVTYHQLSVDQTPAGWRTVIVFDV